MNAKHLVAAFAFLATTGSVFAQEFVVPDANFVSSRTRADVVAEIAEARANGTLDVIDSQYPVVATTGTPKTRAEVSAEIAQARANGTLDVIDSQYPVVASTGTPKTRAQVRAELAEYKAAHPDGQAIYYSGS